MSAVPTLADTGRHATLQLRFGLDEAFHPRPEVRRGDEVVYVGRLAREKGVLELVDAAALAREPWTLRFVGSGPLGESLRARVRARGIADRVAFAPFVSDRAELSRTYAGACVVVMPGAHETFGLVGFEAAASGARLVCCDTAPSAQFVGELAHTYRPGDVPGLARAIEAARCAGADAGAAWRIVERNSWPAAFAAEQAALAELCGGRRVG
jgi:alpha-1,6-mannosyltransferase